MCAIACVDQLNSDSQVVAALLLAAFQNVMRAKFCANIADIRISVAIAKTGIASDHRDQRKACKFCYDTLRYCVGKIPLIRADAEVIEWQNRNGRTVVWFFGDRA